MDVSLSLHFFFIPGIQTFLSSSLLPDGNNPKAPSVSCTKVVHSIKVAMNKKVWIFIFNLPFTNVQVTDYGDPFWTPTLYL